MKKLISILLAAVMAFSCLGIFSSVSFANTAFPYLDDSGYYHRISFGEEIQFTTNYSSVVYQVQSQLYSHSDTIEIMFATNDTEYAYQYDDDHPYGDAYDVAIKLWNDIFYDAMTWQLSAAFGNPARAGDYLFNTISSYVPGAMVYLSKGDEPQAGCERYYPFKITISEIEYNVNPVWERALDSFLSEFRQTYLNDNMSDYEKVKTIYDFIVRNTDYDTDVFTGKYGPTTQRYKIARSAYGALYGSLLKDGKSVADADFSYKTTATGEYVPSKYNQGLAVCEGYSELFYCMCMYNGIPCHIVDGDNTRQSGLASDPHEWNYVYLDDGCGDGYKWFQVDTTFASNKSYKEIDFNNYDYFLRGRENINFGYMNHQQPYYDGMDSVKPQLYYWNSTANAASYKDYGFKTATFTASEGASYGYIVVRTTNYGGTIGTKSVYIYTRTGASQKIEVDEDKNIFYTDVLGFNYNGRKANFTVILPYIVNEEILSVDKVSVQAAGTYPIQVTGANNTVFKTSFKIIPHDMSDKVGNYKEAEIQKSASYMNMNITPKVVIYDSFGKLLTMGEDFTLKYYNSSGTAVSHPNAIGKYKVAIEFTGNYSGTYRFDFEIEKIKLSTITVNEEYALNYYPAYILKKNNITSAAYYITSYAAFGIPLKRGVDFTAASSDSLDYNTKGKITLTGITSSDSLTVGGAKYSRTINYVVSKKFDISELNLKAADSNSTNRYFYTGSEIKPTKFDVIDTVLVKGKDYKIASYSSNVKAGKAYVTIKGINGCTGTLKLPFVINAVNIGEANVTVTFKDSSPVIKVTLGGKTLVKGTDYKQTVTKSNGIYTITLDGIGNYTSKKIVSVVAKSSGSTSTITVKKSKLKKVSPGKKSFTATWKNVSGNVTGYHIQYSLNKSFPEKGSKTVTVKGAKKTKAVIKKLKSKKKYYVRIRTIYAKGKYIYCSAWSSPKAVTVK